jgi:hypothetical protein
MLLINVLFGNRPTVRTMGLDPIYRGSNPRFRAMIQGLYKHYKGNYYFVLGSGLMSENREEWYVAYLSLSKRSV